MDAQYRKVQALAESQKCYLVPSDSQEIKDRFRHYRLSFGESGSKTHFLTCRRQESCHGQMRTYVHQTGENLLSVTPPRRENS